MHLGSAVILDEIAFKRHALDDAINGGFNGCEMLVQLLIGYMVGERVMADSWHSTLPNGWLWGVRLWGQELQGPTKDR